MPPGLRLRPASGPKVLGMVAGAVLVLALVVLGLLLLLGPTASLPATTAGAEATTIPFADARLKIELNATDGDAGLQVFLDGEPWKAVSPSTTRRDASSSRSRPRAP
jgi:hypothetical protein